jgi:AGCS family alanine or glycine:cation symporter
MSSGVEPSAELSGAPFVQAALTETLGAFGPVFITVAMILFAFTTLLGNLYYVDMTLIFICGKIPSKKFMTVYRLIASFLIFLGAGLSADLPWGIADITMGGMTLINMPVIIILSKYAMKALKNYDSQKKAGKEPVFRAVDVEIPYEMVDYWK